VLSPLALSGNHLHLRSTKLIQVAVYLSISDPSSLGHHGRLSEVSFRTSEPTSVQLEVEVDSDDHRM